MDASQPTLSNTQTPSDVEMSQPVGEDLPPTTEEQPSMQSGPNISPNPIPKKIKSASKAAPNADRPLGKSLLPITRVQKILKADKELPTCAREAVFIISVATEEFIKRLGQAAHQQAMREKRTTVQGRDIAIAVRRSDEFAFLQEIIYSGITAPPAPPPVKPKQKDPDTNTINITKAFVRGKQQNMVAATDGHEDSDESHEQSNSAVEQADSEHPFHNNPEDVGSFQGDRLGDDTAMDVS